MSNIPTDQAITDAVQILVSEETARVIEEEFLRPRGVRLSERLQFSGDENDLPCYMLMPDRSQTPAPDDAGREDTA